MAFLKHLDVNLKHLRAVYPGRAEVTRGKRGINMPGIQLPLSVMNQHRALDYYAARLSRIVRALALGAEM